MQQYLNSARARLPECLSENLQTEIRRLDYNNPEAKLLTSEMQNIYVKDPAHPTQSLIKKIEDQIKGVRYQKSIYRIKYVKAAISSSVPTVINGSTETTYKKISKKEFLQYFAKSQNISVIDAIKTDIILTEEFEKKHPELFVRNNTIRSSGHYEYGYISKVVDFGPVYYEGAFGSIEKSEIYRRVSLCQGLC